MSRREPCRSGYEQDCIYARRVYCFTQRAGVVSAAKRAIRRRERRRVPARRVDDPAGARFDEAGERAELRGERCGQCVSGDVGRDGRLPDPSGERLGRSPAMSEPDRRALPPASRPPLPARHDWLEIEPGLFPLADGVSGRVGLLRGAGNAIVPQVAAVFVEEFLGAVCDTEPTP